MSRDFKSWARSLLRESAAVDHLDTGECVEFLEAFVQPPTAEDEAQADAAAAERLGVEYDGDGAAYFSQTERDNGVTPDGRAAELEARASELGVSVPVVATNSEANLKRALEGTVPGRYCSGCGSRVGFEHADNCTREDRSECVVIAECDRFRVPTEVQTMPAVSTSHLTAAEGATAAKDWPRHCLESEFAFAAYIGPIGELEEAIIEAGEEEVWVGFLCVARWAAAQGHAWVLFDRDADVQDDLLTWEW
tara:strand:+ start:12563 stop:13312 length:750 start_codon:yes stop_codon:yes gene_type:complete